MKVIYVASDNNTTSGAFVCLVQLVKEMRSRGVDAKVVLPKEGDGTGLLIESGIPYIIIKSYSWDTPINSNLYYLAKIPIKKALNLIAIRQIEKYLVAEKPDIVHINTTYSYVGAVAAYKLKIPVVWHIREFFEEDQNNRMWNSEKGYAAMDRADALIPVSKAVYDKYKKVFGSYKLHVIHDGVKAERFYDPDKEIFKTNNIKMVCVGGLYPGKGQETLIKALADYMNNHRDVTGDSKISLSLVGRGPEREKLEKLVKEKNLNDIVTFEGYSRKPEKYYKESDIAFMTSKSEAFGLVTVEAMMSGALVLGTDSAGTKEIMEDKVTGLLYKTDSSESLATAMLYAISHKDEMKIIASHGRDEAVKKFTVKANADNIEKVYSEIINKREGLFDGTGA